MTCRTPVSEVWTSDSSTLKLGFECESLSQRSKPALAESTSADLLNESSGDCSKLLCRCSNLCTSARLAVAESVLPTHYELAVASYFAGVKSVRRRQSAVPFGIPLSEICAVEDRVTGLRAVLFKGPERPLPPCACGDPACAHHDGAPSRVACAVLAFRGTRATHRGNLAADLGILRHNARRAELRIAEEARCVVEGFASQLAAGPRGVHYVWVATGHSLGGFLATTVAIRMPLIAQCVAFESPGCPKLYRELAAKRAGERFWRGCITNYLTLPNPINMSHPHVGRVVRIVLGDLLDANGGGHLIKCVAGSLFRWVNWLCLLVAAFLACEVLLGLSLSSAVVRLCALLEAMQSWLLAPAWGVRLAPHLCLAGLGEAATLMHVASAASLSFKGTTALLATRLGANLPFQLAAHKLSNILRAFDPGTGLPKLAVEMASWPHAACFKRSVTRDLRIYLWESFFPTPVTESVRHIFNRRGLVNNRVARLPGYIELQEPEEGEGADPGASRRP